MKAFKQEDLYFDSYSSSSEENDYIDDHHPKKVYVDRTKRLKASARERRRRHVLNDALERLRRKVPSVGTRSSKLSKIEVLRLAIDYIGMLSYYLNYSSPSAFYQQHQQLEQSLHQQQYSPSLEEQQFSPSLEDQQQQMIYNNNNNNNNITNFEAEICFQQQQQQQQQQEDMYQQQQWNIHDTNQMLEMQHLAEMSQLSPMNDFNFRQGFFQQ